MHIIVVGSGIAGLIAALELSRAHQVTLVTKSQLHEANTRYAQGGIAAVMHPDDNVAEHIEDTLRAGAGLCRPEAVRILCEEGPDRIRDLIRLGVAFDQHNGELAQGREAAHSRARVLHAGGDATGLAIETALVAAVQAQAVRNNPRIHVLEHTFAADLQLSENTPTQSALMPGTTNQEPVTTSGPDEDTVIPLEAHSQAAVIPSEAHSQNAVIPSEAQRSRGTPTPPAPAKAASSFGLGTPQRESRRHEPPHVTGLHILTANNIPQLLPADAVLLASGGAGHLYPYTTNPSVATGDGIALALRAGATLADLEFYQFHPTALSAVGGFLISEAVRGDGAVLRDLDGHRFMQDIHPDAELAPRDVVARGIADTMARQNNQPVLLDATHLGADFLATRFPTINAACARAGLDWAHTPIPVAPAAHYWMGGIQTDTHGRTSIPGLFAVGEVACTGVHGANRLASNSLLESIVFAHRAAHLLRENPSAALTPATFNNPHTLNLLELQQEIVIPSGAQRQNAVILSGAHEENAVILSAAQRSRRTPISPEPATTFSGLGRHPQRNGRADPFPSTAIAGSAFTRAKLQQLMWTAAGITRTEATLLSAQTQLRHWLRTAIPAQMIHDRETANLLQLAHALVTAALAREESRGAHFRSDYPTPRESERHHLTVAHPVEVPC